MADLEHVLADGTVAILPHRLNRHPVVVRGLTADELWICCGLSATTGLLLGIPLSWALSIVALAPTCVIVGIAAGVFVGGGILRRQKRGRPDTWLYRHLQFAVARRLPRVAGVLGGSGLITRSLYWSTRREA